MSDLEDIDPDITLKFHLDPVLARTLSRYYILKWSTHYLRSEILNCEGMILHQGIPYRVIFMDTTESDKIENVLLSFRYVEQGDPYGYVLIKPHTQHSLGKILI